MKWNYFQPCCRTMVRKSQTHSWLEKQFPASARFNGLILAALGAISQWYRVNELFFSWIQYTVMSCCKETENILSLKGKIESWLLPLEASCLVFCHFVCLMRCQCYFKNFNIPSEPNHFLYFYKASMPSFLWCLLSFISLSFPLMLQSSWPCKV